MKKSREWRVWFGVVLQLLLLGECASMGHNSSDVVESFAPVQLRRVNENHVVVDNGIVNVTFSVPEGMVTGIQYNGIDNLLEHDEEEDSRGYWDADWSKPDHPSDIYEKVSGSSFKVVVEEEQQVELSFARTWNSSTGDATLPVNVDKRFIMRRGSSGFYCYAIFERPQGYPNITLYQTRIVFKLKQSLFQFMALSDWKQRIMPTAHDRATGQPLAYKEAVLLTNPSDPSFRGEVDDKYQYSSDNKDSRVYGWISANSSIGMWTITPSNEFKTGGPVKQDLTCHTGPIMLSMFVSTHYSGVDLALRFGDGEPWKKVFGPVFFYLNSVSPQGDPLELWPNAKQQLLLETASWPYNFSASEDFFNSSRRGSVSGRLLVHDRYINSQNRTTNTTYVGLALPGEAGSWQTESKGYQFWTQTDAEGHFIIKDVIPGNYSLYGWVPGFIGDYKHNVYVNVISGSTIELGNLVYEPPRNGPTLWEIGIPDRTAAEFYVPDPNPIFQNLLYVNDTVDKFRQYGLWDRYADIYPEQDQVFVVGVNNYRKDWFFAHVNRLIGNKTYIPTTWRVMFDLRSVNSSGNYTLRVALAAASQADIHVGINGRGVAEPVLRTGMIGRDNAIARHGIHGLYWLFTVDLPSSLLLEGNNTLLLTQTRGASPWSGLMYDYIRLEAPPETN